MPCLFDTFDCPNVLQCYAYLNVLCTAATKDGKDTGTYMYRVSLIPPILQGSLKQRRTVGVKEC